MKFTQTIRSDGTDIYVTISDEQGKVVKVITWRGAGKYVRESGGLQGYTQLLVPTSATIDIKPC